jgi:hypothetical protein
MPNIEDALAYLGIDYADEAVTRNVTRALAAADKTLKGAVGADVWDLMPNDERAQELTLIYLDDLYSDRGVSAKVSGAVRLSVATMELQLRLELARLRADKAGGTGGTGAQVITDATGQEMVAAILSIRDAINGEGEA